jgi:hypothetical protein
MCSYQTLFHNDNSGYVVRCKECENIQIGFGNLMLTVNDTEFESFHKWLKQMLDEQAASDIKETIRCIVIPTPCDGIKLLLSLRELRQFDHMLEEADTELKSFSLLKLFTTH